MSSWKKYHEIMSIVSAGEGRGGKIVGAVLEDTYDKKSDRLLVMDDQFYDLVRMHQIQNFEFDDSEKLKIEYSKSDIDYMRMIAPGISNQDIDSLVNTTSCIDGWLMQDVVLHKRLVNQFIQSKKHIGIGRNIEQEDLCTIAEVYFKSSLDAEAFIQWCTPGITDILSKEKNILVISNLNISPIRNGLRDIGVILY